MEAWKAGSHEPTSDTLEYLVRRATSAGYTDEYNCKLRRLYPWPNHADTKRQITEFGVIWVVLEPGKAVDAHDHDEEETFIVVEGSANLELDGQHTFIERGDVVYIPRFSQHQLCNASQTALFVMVDIYWDWHGRSGPEPGSAGVER